MKSQIQFNILTILIGLSLLIYFTYTSYEAIKSLNNTSIRYHVDEVEKIWVPEITFCVDSVDYTISCKAYGNDCLSSDYNFKKYMISEHPEIFKLYSGNLNGDRCYVFNTTTSSIFNKNLGVGDYVEAPVVITFNQTPFLEAWGYISIWHPLRASLTTISLDLLQPVYNISETKIYTFSYKEYLLLSKTDYEIDYFIDKYSSESNNIMKIGFLPRTYVIESLEEYKPISIWTVVGNSIALIGTLYSIFQSLIGRGPYSPTGIIHKIFSYHQIEHIQKSDEMYNLTKEDNFNKPSLKEILPLYLAEIEKAKYN